VLTKNPEIHNAIIDLHLGGTDGLTLIKRIQEWKPEVNLVLMSGMIEQKIVQITSEMGVWTFAKPITRDILKIVLEDVPA